VTGILRIAYKLLVNDKGKFVALLVGITFAVFLMVQMTSLFAGILSKASATVINIGAKVWVMDTAVTTVANCVDPAGGARRAREAPPEPAPEGDR